MRRHGWIRKFINDFEHDPHVQFKFHTFAMFFWMLNAVVALVIFIFFPQVWIAIGILYVLLLSLYANWDTDYDAMSASGAWMEAQSLKKDNVAVDVKDTPTQTEVDVTIDKSNSPSTNG